MCNFADPPIIVLTYHRVTSLAHDPQLLAVSPELFEVQMRYLKENYPVARFEDDWSLPRKPAFVITFDDGYADNVEEALPILEKVGVPATFFVSTANINTHREFWWDDLERLVLHDGDVPVLFECRDGKKRHRWSVTNNAEKWQLYQELHQLLKRCDAPERERWFSRLRDWAGMGEEGRATHLAMNDAELHTLAANPLVTIGAHTISHVALSAISPARQEEEIAGSKYALEKMAGTDIRVFSYPFGSRKDFTDVSRDICLKAGFVRTAANFPGQVHRWTDPHRIPRQLVRNWPIDVFSKKIDEFIRL